MKRSQLLSTILALSIGSASRLFAASGNQVFELASQLSGTFKGSTPGNELRLDLRPVPTNPQSQYDLFLEVSGKYQGQIVRRQGLLRLESQGPDVYVGYIPHFDATVSSLSPDAARFTQSEVNAACGFNLNSSGDGFAGETSGASCAFAMRGAVGKWSVEIEPGSIRIREVKSGETLRFQRAGKN